VTQRFSTSTETGANFRAAYEDRMRRRDEGRPWQNKRGSEEESKYFRELVLSKVGRLTPRWQKQLQEEVEAEWGPVCWRRLQRAVKWLVDHGEIVRTPDGYLLVWKRRA
jgi:hypothetical protein